MTDRTFPKRTRAHWWQTPPGHIPYGERVLGGLAMGALFGAATAHVTGSAWGWFGFVIGFCLVPLGIWMEWKDGY